MGIFQIDSPGGSIAALFKSSRHVRVGQGSGLAGILASASGKQPGYNIDFGTTQLVKIVK
jgi:hypothetical protein